MSGLPYLQGYPAQLLGQVEALIAQKRLGAYLLGKYPSLHEVRTDKALYEYAMAVKNEYLRQSAPLSKVAFDSRINLVHQALGLHTFASRVQGGRLKAKHEIRIGSVFRTAPPEFLRMIVAHELAHLKEKEHNRAFYQLCQHMEPAYHQLEFDLRLYLIHLERFGELYSPPAGQTEAQAG